MKKLLELSANCCLKAKPSSSHERKGAVLGRHPHPEDSAHCEGGQLTHPCLGRNQMSTGLAQQFSCSLRGLPVKTCTLYFSIQTHSSQHPTFRMLSHMLLSSTEEDILNCQSTQKLMVLGKQLVLLELAHWQASHTHNSCLNLLNLCLLLKLWPKSSCQDQGTDCILGLCLRIG